MPTAVRSSLVAVAVATGVVALAASGWLPRPPGLRAGAESAVASASAGAPRPDAGKIDARAVVDQVRHRVIPGSAGDLTVAADAYRATFDEDGFAVAPAPGDRASALRISVASVARRGSPVALAPEGWSARGNVAARDLAPAVEEVVTARSGEVEWDLVLDAAPPGRGPLTVEARVTGALDDPERVGRGPTSAWRYAVGAAPPTRVGALVVRDASGAELHRVLPEARKDRLRLSVPEEVLRHARYPLTLDPTIAPERPVAEVGTYGAAPSTQRDPTVAWNGSVFLVVWSDDRSANPLDVLSGAPPSEVSPVQLFGTRVTPTGTVLDPSGLPLSRSGGASQPAVASDGQGFLVVWERQLAIQGVRVTGGGAVTGASFSIAQGGTEPAVTWNGTAYIVAWTHQSVDVRAARVDQSGTVLDPAGVVVSLGSNHQRRVSVAAAGGTSLVVWERYSGTQYDVYGARLGANGALLGAAFAVSEVNGNQTGPEVASSGAAFLVIWEASAANGIDIRGSRVNTAGTVLDPASRAVSTAGGTQAGPDLAWTGNGYLAAWSDSRNGSFEVFGTRLDAAATALDPAGIPISAGPDPERLLQTAVASGGGTSFVTWYRESSSGADVLGARVNGSGTVLDPTAKLLSAAAGLQLDPAVAWNGTDHLVVWAVLGPSGLHIRGARLRGDGSLRDPAGFAITSAPGAPLFPAVAWNGTDFVVVWEAAGNIFGARVSAGGVVRDPGGITLSAAGGTQSAPAVVGGTGGDVLVTWDDTRSGGKNVYGSRLSAAGSVRDPNGIPISTAAGDQSQSSSAWDGASFLVVWQDRRSGAEQVWSARVTAAGGVRDPAGIQVSTGRGTQSAPQVAWGDGTFLVVWQLREAFLDAPGIIGARLSSAGAVRDPEGFDISPPTCCQQGDVQGLPVLAWSGSAFLVVWEDQIYDAPSRDLFGSLVASDATVVDRGIPVATVSTEEGRPAVSSAGPERWGVVYERFAAEPPYGNHRVFFRSLSK